MNLPHWLRTWAKSRRDRRELMRRRKLMAAGLSRFLLKKRLVSPLVAYCLESGGGTGKIAPAQNVWLKRILPLVRIFNRIAPKLRTFPRKLRKMTGKHAANQSRP